jgi:hypothetical protein
MFGDAKISELGAEVNGTGPSTTFDNIYLQYLSTIGSKANSVGIIDQKVSYSSSISIGSGNINITSYIALKFISNITGGADIESADSIRESAPALFYSLNRLVDNKDYARYLKSLTSPINVKNAIAWGEQEEAEAKGVVAIQELFNVILFTCAGDLYMIEGDEETATYGVRSSDNRLSESVLDEDLDEDGFSNQSCFNVYVNQRIVKQLKEYIYTGSIRQIHNAKQIDNNYIKFKNTYPSVGISIVIGSDKYLTSTQKIKTISLNMSIIDSMSNISSLLQSSLRSVMDDRDPLLVREAFPGITVSWSETERKFDITGNIDDLCFLKSFDSSTQIVQDLGFYNTSGSEIITLESQQVYTTKAGNLLSAKISEVISNLAKKAYPTVKHVYITPAIQSFNLTGTIYINQLYDKEESRRKINNATYVYLSQMADFGKPIYISNLIQLIEDFEDVYYADISLEPAIPQNNTGRPSFFYPEFGRYSTIDSNKDWTGIYSAVLHALELYLPVHFAAYSYSPSETTALIWYAFVESLKEMTAAEIYADHQLSLFTERFFVTTFAKAVYDKIVSYIGSSPAIPGISDTKFQDTSLFMNLMSDIHKDVSWAIRNNILDSKKNIAPEFEVQDTEFGTKLKRYIRGGYSIGQELSKIEITASYEYKM